MTDEMLRRAASVLRGQVDKLTTDTDEWDDCFPAAQVCADQSSYGRLIVHPIVGLALADWLDAEADGFELYEATARVVVALDGGARVTHSTHQEALAVARAVLGEQP